MRTIFCFFLLFTAVIFANAQKADPVKAFFNKFKEEDGVTKLSLGGIVLDIAAKFTDDEEAADIVRKLSRLRLLTFDNYQGQIAPADILALKQGVKASRFEDLMQIRSGGERIDIMIREDGDRITDLLLLIDQPDEFLLLNLEGVFRYEDLRQLEIDVDGSEQLKKLPADRKDLPRA